MERSADYIVAGAGSAGCILARRLAETGASVILLEAGGPDRTRLVRQPGMIAIFHNVPALKKRLDWGYYTAPQAGALGRRIPQPRGRVLGGSGSINGMVFVRGNRQNYDDWAAAGCAGVYGSPQLLMLSGVGPAGHLRQHGITVAADLPVGDNLHDHLFVPMTYCMTSARNRGTTPYFVRGALTEAIRGGCWMGRTVFEVLGFVRSPRATGPGQIPDLQVHVLPWSYPFPNQDSPARHKVDKRSALTIMPTLIYPKSRGTLRLASADPSAAPVIDPGYLTEPDDARLLLDGMELIRATMASKIIAGQFSLELSPGPVYPDRAALARELPNRATSVYHAVGTCRIGTDERAVVDPALRVRGIDGLRVADASIMPSIPGGNTNAPAMMIGEHCASLMGPALWGQPYGASLMGPALWGQPYGASLMGPAS